MSCFKKFGGFCSGFACFAALIWLFAEFMTADFEEEIGFKDKLKVFFEESESLANKLMLVLAVMLVISILASVVFKRIPYVTLIFSVPPLMLSVDMVKDGYIENYPMMYILFCGVAVLSGVWECISRDRLDGGHRVGLAGDAVALAASGSMFFIWKRAEFLSLGESFYILELNHFDLEIYENLENMDIKIFLVLACTYLGLALVSLLLKDIYFIDAILAAVPFVATVYMWSAGKLTAHAELVVTASAIYFAVRLISALSGRSYPRQIED